MATTQLGATLIIGGQVTVSGYIVEQDTSGGNEIDSEDINDADGKKTSRLIYGIYPKRNLTLIAKTGATPATTFPEGAKCTDAGLSNFFVDSAPIVETKSATKVTVQMTDLGF